ncbi:MAG: excisionase family DNA-binding protein [Bryobacteraceae bacterium]|jgi:excisionase family DNA binding protein
MSELAPVHDPAGGPMKHRLSVAEIASRLAIGKMSVYSMLEDGRLPGIRIGKRWLITRLAYEQWERNCGLPPRA